MDRGPTERKLYDLFQRFFALNVPILASTGINVHHKTGGLTTNKNVGILESLRGLSGNMLYVRRRGTHMDQADHVQDATYWSDEHLDPNDGKTVNSLWRLEAILKLGSPSFLRVWCLKTSNTYHTLKNNTLSNLQKKPVKPDDPPLYPPSTNIHTIAPCLLQCCQCLPHQRLQRPPAAPFGRRRWRCTENWLRRA